MRCVVVAGADINKYDYILNEIRSDDYFIYCDCGLKHLDKLNIKPNLVVGDFDSYKEPSLDVEIIKLPKEKDDTDSVFAIKESLKRGFKEFILIGFIGNRMDHTLVNIACLELLDVNDAKGIVIDDYSIMELVKDQPVIVDRKYPYFSLLNIYGDVDGINIKGAKYNLTNAKISTYYQYATSNEVLDDFATIYVKKGKLLLIKILEV